MKEYRTKRPANCAGTAMLPWEYASWCIPRGTALPLPTPSSRLLFRQKYRHHPRAARPSKFQQNHLQIVAKRA